MKWKTKDGQWLKVKDMTDAHIQNCIGMLQRRLRHIDHEEGAAYSCMCFFQGDHAQDAIISDIHSLKVERGRIEAAIEGFRKEIRSR
jgi:hypothetical protein